MATTFNISIVTPEKVLFEGPAVYLLVPGSAGSMGILPDHAPLLSSLNPGAFELRLAQEARSLSGKSIFFKTQKTGFIEINKNTVSILLDAADSSLVIA